MPDIIEHSSKHNRIVAVYLAEMSQTSRRVMEKNLRLIARVLTNGESDSVPWEAVKNEHIVAVKLALQEANYAPATINNVLASFRGVVNTLFNQGIIGVEERDRRAAVKGVPDKQAEPAGRSLTSSEKNKVFRAFSQEQSKRSVRDRAIISTMLILGLRRAEIASLDLECIDENGYMRWTAKGSLKRVARVPEVLLEKIDEWVYIRGERPGALFTPLRAEDKVTSLRSMSHDNYREICRYWARKAGIEPFSPHDLRRTFITDMLNKNVDLARVSRLAGHSKLETTKRYDRRPAEEDYDALDKLRLPN